MNTPEELQAFIEGQGFGDDNWFDGIVYDETETGTGWEVINVLLNSGLFFTDTGDELLTYMSEAIDVNNLINQQGHYIGDDFLNALRIAQIFWNSDYTPEQQEDMTQFFVNMYDTFGELYPTLEDNITAYEQVSATVGGCLLYTSPSPRD